MSEYQPRTPERLVEILRSQDRNPRSWQQEAATEIERMLRQPQCAREPVAWFCFVPSPHGEAEPLRIRAWTTDEARAKSLGEVIGRTFTPLYASPVSQCALDEYRNNLIEQCAKVAEGTGAAMFSDSEVAAVDALRADIASGIRGLAVSRPESNTP